MYNPNPNVYNRRTPSHIASMIKAVFSSKAVLAMLIFLGIACIANLYIAVTAYSFTDNFFDSESFHRYYIFYFDQYISEYTIETIYIGLKSAMNFVGLLFIAFAVGDAWAFAGMLTAYSNAKNPDTSPRAGFTVIQVLAVTKSVLEALPSVLMLMILLEAFSEQPEGFIVYVFLILLVVFNMIKSISLIVAVSCLKRTLDGTWFSSGGSGVLQFSSMTTGILTTVATLISSFFLLVPTETDIPESVQNDITVFQLFFVFCLVFALIPAIIDFLTFAIARHYSKKLPLAVNAQNAYHANMSNLYPDNDYTPFPQQKQPYYPPYNQSYHQQPYIPDNQYYQSPTESNRTNYPPYQEQPFQGFPDNNHNNPYSDNF